MKRMIKTGFTASAILFSAAVLFSCSNEQDPGVEFAPDMYHSVPLDPYSQIKENKFNPAGMNMREPVKGTVARGKQGYNVYLSEDNAETAGAELKNPLARNTANLEEGKVLYARFCSPCHGAEGDGQGLVGQKFKGVPSYTAGRVAELPGGHIYHVITYGRGRMLPHGSQVNPEERWKIVMYVQQLQKGETGTAVSDDASEEAAQEADEAGTKNPVTGTPNN
ncbi:c-type cytochrome [Pontibacter flavimaris]|uniref:Cytochrome c class I n=1 Tax=Pontibacter flavimaris TaxID=1797110 RepID=A0A1Q5PB77_9BACT|nr:cytochrome c [Pontibacter flavimaris]OKL39463.1 cytochrome c class I [Pontibacter flavimaris]